MFERSELRPEKNLILLRKQNLWKKILEELNKLKATSLK